MKSTVVHPAGCGRAVPCSRSSQQPWPREFSAGAAAEGWILGLPLPLSFSAQGGLG